MSSEPKPSVLLAQGMPSESGTPDFSSWFANVTLRPRNARSFDLPVIPSRPESAGSVRARPSDAGHGSLPGAALFAESAGLALGTEVHEALAVIEWFPHPPLSSALSTVAREVLEAFLACPEIALLFKRPSEDAEVWRERSVACRLEGTTYSAQMDRVVVIPPSGKSQKGRILLVDFKTDQGEPEEIARRYRPQLEIYARILEVWSCGRHEISAAVATVRKPALIRIC